MPIPIAMAIVIYFTTWWIVLFAVLPWGVRSQDEMGAVVPGTERGAPAAPHMLAKLLWTTLISAVVFGIILLLFAYFD